MASNDPAKNNKIVMPELAFELDEIFRTRLFSFPLDDHESAREIFRYLLDRGVPEDELAHVIQSSTNSMTLWLCRTGLKKMVGEWIISWINKCYDQYLQREASGRTQEKPARECHHCLKENCTFQRDNDRKLGKGPTRSVVTNHCRSISRPETVDLHDSHSFLKLNLDKSSDSLKFFQSGGKQIHSPHSSDSNNNLYLHLMCKNIVTLIRKGSDMVLSLAKLPPPEVFQDISMPSELLPRDPPRPAYRSFSFPALHPDKRWRHFKFKTESKFFKCRTEKRDSGIEEDFDSYFSETNSHSIETVVAETSEKGPTFADLQVKS